MPPRGAGETFESLSSFNHVTRDDDESSSMYQETHHVDSLVHWFLNQPLQQPQEYKDPVELEKTLNFKKSVSFSTDEPEIFEIIHRDELTKEHKLELWYDKRGFKRLRDEHKKLLDLLRSPNSKINSTSSSSSSSSNQDDGYHWFARGVENLLNDRLSICANRKQILLGEVRKFQQERRASKESWVEYDVHVVAQRFQTFSAISLLEAQRLAQTDEASVQRLYDDENEENQPNEDDADQNRRRRLYSTTSNTTSCLGASRVDVGTFTSRKQRRKMTSQILRDESARRFGLEPNGW